MRNCAEAREAPIIVAVKIYTKTGDSGETGLFGGARVSKADPAWRRTGTSTSSTRGSGCARAPASRTTELAAMLEQIQRDLFALGARLADPGAHDRRPRRRRPPVAAGRHRPARRVDRRARGGRCRRCGGSSSPADRRRRRAARRAHRLPPRRARHGRALGPTRPFEPELLDLRQPPVGSAVRDGRRREPARGDARNRVVSRPTRSRAPTPTASGWRGRTTRIFPSPRGCCPARMRPHIAADLRVRARWPTTSPTSPAVATADRLADLDAWDACLNAAALGTVQRGEPHAEVFVALRHTIERVPAARRRCSTICSARSGRT